MGHFRANQAHLYTLVSFTRPDNRGVNISEREIIAVGKLYKTGKMYFPADVKSRLELEPPCTIVFEVNEEDEIVVRQNELNHKGGD